jgi:hypothetical protein
VSVALIAVFMGTAHAQSGAIAGTESVAGAISGSQAGAVGFGGGGGSSRSSSANQNIVGSGNVYEAVDYGDAVGVAVAPHLFPTAPCLVGYSGGLGLSGLSISGGGYKRDVECDRRSNANEARANGNAALAHEIDCGNKYYFEADTRMATASGIAPSCVQVVVENPDEVIAWFPQEIETLDEVAMLDMEASKAKTRGYDYAEVLSNR